MVDKKTGELEKLVKELEGEENFDIAIEKFGSAAKLVKELLGEVEEKKGRVLEVIKTIDGMIEKEMQLADCEE